MESVVTSLAKAKYWIRSLADQQENTSSLPSAIESAFDSPHNKKKKYVARSAPELATNGVCSKQSSYLDRLSYICNNAIGGQYFSPMLRRHPCRLKSESLDDLFNIGDFSRRESQEDSLSVVFKEFHQNSSDNEIVQEPHRYIKQQSGDSGIFMDDDDRFNTEMSSPPQRKRFSSFFARRSIFKGPFTEGQEITPARESETLDDCNIPLKTRLRKSLRRKTQPCLSLKTKVRDKASLSCCENIYLSNEPAKTRQKIKSLEARGRIKLALQYFTDTKQLRVIIVRADQLKVKNGDIIAKLALNGDTFSVSESTSRARVKDNDVQFKKEIYIDVDSQGLEGAELSLRLFKISNLFNQKTAIGEIRILLDDLDLKMDTSFWVHLVQPTDRRLNQKVGDVTVNNYVFILELINLFYQIC